MEKRFKPSQKRLEKAREQGNLSKSQYLTQSVVVFAAILIILNIWGKTWVELRILLQYCWVDGYSDPNLVARKCLRLALLVVVKTLGVICMAGVCAEVYQSGLFLKPGIAKLQLQRLDFANGVGKIFLGLKELPYIIISFLCCSAFLGEFFYNFFQNLTFVFFASTPTKLQLLTQSLTRLAFCGAFILLITGVAHYLLAKRKWMQSVGMSLQDLHEEHKENESDPVLRAYRRAQHEELAKQDLVNRIRASRVIVIERS
jgi:flagellar biosynthesis protein FlhB